MKRALSMERLEDGVKKFDESSSDEESTSKKTSKRSSKDVTPRASIADVKK